MEPEVHLIEKYFQEIEHCFTMTNIKCKKNKEIDLLALHPKTGEKYHVESRIGTSPSFRIREKDTFTSKGIPHKISLDYFAKEKFDNPVVTEKIAELLGDTRYQRILVVWEVEDYHLIHIAEERFNYKLWFISDILDSLLSHLNKGKIKGSRDDVLRTLELVCKRKKYEKEVSEIDPRHPRLRKGSTKTMQREMAQLGRKTAEEI